MKLYTASTIDILNAILEAEDELNNLIAKDAYEHEITKCVFKLARLRASINTRLVLDIVSKAA